MLALDTSSYKLALMRGMSLSINAPLTAQDLWWSDFSTKFLLLRFIPHKKKKFVAIPCYIKLLQTAKNKLLYIVVYVVK